MTDRRDQEKEELESWEKWPLAALFLANALNVFILYVPQEDMPAAIQWMLPWARVFCGLAAAASLEGTLIAVTMGRRLGRDSRWSWATMFAASAFTAAVAYYVHHEIGLAAALLFMGQAVVLFIYTQHLAQPKNTLRQPKARATDGATRLGSGETAIVLAQSKSHDTERTSIIPRKCRKCGQGGFDTLADVNLHQRTACPNRSN